MIENKKSNSMIRVISYPNVFTPEECNKITSLKGLNLQESSVYIQNNVQGLAASSYPNARDIIPTKETQWIEKRIENTIETANNSYFKFDIRCMSGLRINKYEKGSYFDWHVDMSNIKDGSLRKLTLLVMLSKRDSYKGGDLRWWGVNNNINDEQGSVIVFPCYMLHSVTPLLEGLRYSIVCMAMGPSFV